MEKISFYDQVYQVVRVIPAGRVSSYGAIASYLGTKGSARMVGYAMNAAGTAFPPVPAHRVLNRKGFLTGKFHFSSPDMMEQLLKSEGIEIEDDRVRDFETLFWDPSTELKL
jgi:methylated-DNA-protein-cysteine methyltransferase-like protein